jgi:hypothetical protein
LVSDSIAQVKKVVVTGSAVDGSLAAQVTVAADLPDGAMLAGRTTLSQLAALVAGASLVVCGDTGIAHLAIAYRTPSVVLFGPVSPQHWGPSPHRPQHVALWAGTTGDTFSDQPDPGLLRITTAEVIAATGFGSGLEPDGGQRGWHRVAQQRPAVVVHRDGTGTGTGQFGGADASTEHADTGHHSLTAGLYIPDCVTDKQSTARSAVIPARCRATSTRSGAGLAALTSSAAVISATASSTSRMDRSSSSSSAGRGGGEDDLDPALRHRGH